MATFIKSTVSVSLTDPKTFYNTFDNFLNTSSNKNQVSWVYSCIDIWGKHFANVKFRLYEEKQDGDKEEIVSHPIVDMFRKPNNFQTWWDIKYRFAPHFAFYGNVYLYKLRNGLGLPMGLIQLLPSGITAMQSTSGGILEYQYNTGATIVRLKAEDVIHIPYPDGDNLTMGRPIISNIADEVEVRKYQSAYEKQFYKKGGFLGLHFSTDKEMSQEVFDRTKESLKATYGRGVDSSFDVGLTESGLKPVVTTHTMKDMDISANKKINMEEICGAFQVNKFLFGMAESINRATAQEITIQFTTGVIEPLMTYADIILTQKLAIEFGKNLCIEHDNTSPRDQAGELEYYHSGITDGWLTPNEVRKWESLEDREEPYMNVPLDLSKQNPITQTVN